MISYTVRCQFSDPSVAAEWLDWLTSVHLDDVLAGGAAAASIFEMDAPDLTYEIRYQFPDRASFKTYEKEHAPALRAEGLQRFPLSRGLTYERTVGEIRLVAPVR